MGEKNFSLHRIRPNDQTCFLFVYWFVDNGAAMTFLWRTWSWGEENFSLHRIRPNDQTCFLFVYWFVDNDAAMTFCGALGDMELGGEKLFVTSNPTERQTCSSFCVLVCRQRRCDDFLWSTGGHGVGGRKTFRYIDTDRTTKLIFFLFMVSCRRVVSGLPSRSSRTPPGSRCRRYIFEAPRFPLANVCVCCSPTCTASTVAECTRE